MVSSLDIHATFCQHHSLVLVFSVGSILVSNLKRLFLLGGALTMAVAVTGCSTPRTVADVGFPLATSDLHIAAHQQELVVETSQSNAMAFGGGVVGVLVAASVDGTRNRRAEDAVTELREALSDFSMSDEFLQRIETAGLAAQLSTRQPLILRDERGEDFVYSGPFIDVTPVVRMNNAMSALEVELSVWERELNSRGRPRIPNFVQSYQYVYPLAEPASGKSRDDYAQAWLEMGPDAIKELIREGMDQTVHAAMIHFRDRELTPALKMRYHMPRYSNRIAYNLHRDAGDWVWLSRPPVVSTMLITRSAFAVPIN